MEQALEGAALSEVRTLFLEYARDLGFSLCFQGFDAELASLPGKYAPPRGTLLLEPGLGCVGLRELSPGTAELKRLYVRPAGRGLGLGKKLTLAALQHARTQGFERVVLDTISKTMPQAIALYRSLGFREIAPYYDNPIEGALYLALELR